MANDKFGLQRYSPSDQILEIEPLEGQAAAPKKSYPQGWSSYGGYGENTEEEKFDFRALLRAVRKHKFLIFSIVTIVTTLVALQMFRTKPWYTASTVLEIGKENTMVLKSGDVTLNDDSDPNYLVNINTKKLALENPELYEKVVVENKVDQNPKIIEAINKKSLLSFLNFSTEKQNESDKKAARDKADEETARLAPFVAYIQKNVKIEQVKNARALKISYTDEDPELASAVTNSISKVFSEQSFDNQTEKFTNSANWLDQSTRELKSKVQASEEALAAYTRDKQIYSTDLGGSQDKNPTLTTSKLTQLHDQFIRAQNERMLKQSLYQQVQAGRIAELPDAFSDPKITQYQQLLAALQTQEAELKVKFGPTNPKMIEVQNQISVLSSQIETSRKALESKLKADFDRASQDEQSFGAALNSAKVGAVSENQAFIKYNILKQDVETARGLYTDFLQKTNQAKVQVAEQNNNIKVIQPAKAPTSPDGPKRLMIILAGFVLSLGTGVGLAYFIEFLNDTIITLEDVERYVQLPSLGLIPSISKSSKGFFKGRRDKRELSLSEDGSHLGLEAQQNSLSANIISGLDRNSLAGEAYRGLRTSLLLSTAETPPKTILITSSQPGEGKSTTAINTAVTLAQLGAKVLIIDCDLRKPTVHKHLNISSASGVTNYLSSSTELDSLIQESPIPNLSVIPSGPIPPNPAELLSSKKMKDMLSLLGEKFDHIIIDSPPILNVTDPIILSTIVNGTVLVIHSGKSSRFLVKRCSQELSAVRSKIFGVVLNNVDLKKDGYDYYYYRYSHYNNN
jgi:succinoglycan biosynthesis transport protein ExoP